MSAVDNIITVSNLFEVVSKVKEKVGYEYQAPLEADEQNEVTSRTIKEKILGAASE